METYSSKNSISRTSEHLSVAPIAPSSKPTKSDLSIQFPPPTLSRVTHSLTLPLLSPLHPIHHPPSPTHRPFLPHPQKMSTNPPPILPSLTTKTDQRHSFPAAENAILAYWNEIDAFETSQKLNAEKPKFKFYDGPPFATGLPHYGHLLAGSIKVTLFPTRMECR